MKTTTKKVPRRQEKSVGPKKEVPVQSAPEKQIDPTRETLKHFSKHVKDLVKEGKFKTINEALLATFYCDERNTDFRSFLQWNKDGFHIKKGEKAFLLWGKPKEQHTVKEDPEKDEDYTYWPIAKVFSNAQVVARDKTATRENLAKLREEHSDRDQEMER